MNMAKSIPAPTQKDILKQEFINTLHTNFNISPDEASDLQIYKALSAVSLICSRKKDSVL